MATPNEIRARVILQDIYNRHGIEPGTDPAEAIAIIEKNAARDGALPAGWANEAERTAAREEYARKGKTPGEVLSRWQESIYLLDPHTQKFAQNYMRDIDFIEGSKPAVDTSRPGKAELRPANVRGITRGGEAIRKALSYWDASNNSPLYRKDWSTGTYAGYGGAGAAMADAMTNPDTISGSYLGASEIVPNTLRMQGSGESGSIGESYDTAVAHHLANKTFRLNSPAPVLNMPSDATAEQRFERKQELQGLAGKAAIPQADERWQRTMGFVPAGFIQDIGDGLLSTADPTLLLTGGAVAKTIGVPALKSAAIAGRGWAKPYVLNATKQAGTSLGWDQVGEQATGAALLGSMGGQQGRSQDQYFLGGGDPVQYKTDAQVQEAKEARKELGAQAREAGVSTDAREAYKKLMWDRLLK